MDRHECARAAESAAEDAAVTLQTPPLLVLRVDVTAAHGTGHLMRGKALGDAWQRAGGNVEVATTSDLTPYAAWLGGLPIHQLAPAVRIEDDARATAAHATSRGAAWIAADGYHFDAAWQTVAGAHTRLLLFDDCGHGTPHSAHLVLNQNPGADPALYNLRTARTRVLLGGRYAVLRDAFLKWQGWRRTTPARARRLLVTFGGSDPANLTLRILPALRSLRDLEIEIVVGAANGAVAEIESLCTGTGHLHVRRNVTDMPDLIAACDLALGAAGSTTLECAYLQTPQILITVADNQRRLAAELAAGGAAEHLGWHTEVAAEAVATAVERLAESADRRAAMSAAGGMLVDAFGAARVVAQMRGELLTLRPAEAGDARRLFEWANDPATRAASFESGAIDWETHTAWFERKLHDPHTRFWIGVEDDEAIGVVRFALEGEDATISIAVAPGKRGMGYGPALIARASRELFSSTATARIHAAIKSGNQASMTAFHHSGYDPAEPRASLGQPAEHFLLHRQPDEPF